MVDENDDVPSGFNTMGAEHEVNSFVLRYLLNEASESAKAKGKDLPEDIFAQLETGLEGYGFDGKSPKFIEAMKEHMRNYLDFLLTPPPADED